MKRITVAVLAFNEQHNLPDLFASLASQTLPAAEFEILVVDNGSRDGTRDLVRDWQARLANLRLVIQPVPGIAASRNAALRAAVTPLIAFTDADVICPPHWLRTLVEGFDRHRAGDSRLVAVGGGNRPVRGGGPFLDAIGITLNSFWGSHGSVQGMRFGADRPVEHIPTLNICYDRERVLAAGGFDENFRLVCEDPELNHRLTRAGGRIVYLADAEIEHKMRANLRSWLRNVYLYGRGRTQILRKHPDHWRLKFLAPPLLLLALLLLPFGFRWPICWLPALYFPAVAPLAWLLCRRNERPDLFATVYAILAANPIAYGLGMIHGLWYRYPPVAPRPVPAAEKELIV
ncbi:MAG: glycosyltransferase [Myxococcales bacterium]|nr:glycosyltransferase [Myxococcales bacterium]